MNMVGGGKEVTTRVWILSTVVVEREGSETPRAEAAETAVFELGRSRRLACT